MEVKNLTNRELATALYYTMHKNVGTPGEDIYQLFHETIARLQEQPDVTRAQRLLAAVDGMDYICAVKRIREIEATSLKEAKDIVDEMRARGANIHKER